MTIFVCAFVLLLSPLVHCSKDVLRFTKDIHNEGVSMNAVLMECQPKDQAKATVGLTDCQEKILVTIRIDPNDKHRDKEKYLLLEEVFDPQKKAKAKLIQPYLIQLSSESPVLMYPLKYENKLKCKNCKRQPKSGAKEGALHYVEPLSDREADELIKELEAKDVMIQGDIANLMNPRRKKSIQADEFVDYNDNRSDNLIGRSAKHHCSCGCPECTNLSDGQKCQCCDACRANQAGEGGSGGGDGDSNSDASRPDNSHKNRETFDVGDFTIPEKEPVLKAKSVNVEDVKEKKEDKKVEMKEQARATKENPAPTKYEFEPDSVMMSTNAEGKESSSHHKVFLKKLAPQSNEVVFNANEPDDDSEMPEFSKREKKKHRHLSRAARHKKEKSRRFVYDPNYSRFVPNYRHHNGGFGNSRHYVNRGGAAFDYMDPLMPPLLPNRFRNMANNMPMNSVYNDRYLVNGDYDENQDMEFYRDNPIRFQDLNPYYQNNFQRGENMNFNQEYQQPFQQQMAPAPRPYQPNLAPASRPYQAPIAAEPRPYQPQIAPQPRPYQMDSQQTQYQPQPVSETQPYRAEVQPQHVETQPQHAAVQPHHAEAHQFQADVQSSQSQAAPEEEPDQSMFAPNAHPFFEPHQPKYQSHNDPSPNNQGANRKQDENEEDNDDEDYEDDEEDEEVPARTTTTESSCGCGARRAPPRSMNFPFATSNENQMFNNNDLQYNINGVGGVVKVNGLSGGAVGSNSAATSFTDFNHNINGAENLNNAQLFSSEMATNAAGQSGSMLNSDNQHKGDNFFKIGFDNEDSQLNMFQRQQQQHPAHQQHTQNIPDDRSDDGTGNEEEDGDEEEDVEDEDEEQMKNNNDENPRDDFVKDEDDKKDTPAILEDKWPSVLVKSKFPAKFPRVFNTKTRRTPSEDYGDEDDDAEQQQNYADEKKDKFLSPMGAKLLSDKNLTMQDKMSFLNSFELNQQLDDDYRRLTKLNEPGVFKANISPAPDPTDVILHGKGGMTAGFRPHKIVRNKRSYYDDLTYFDDYEQEESKFNEVNAKKRDQGRPSHVAQPQQSLKNPAVAAAASSHSAKQSPKSVAAKNAPAKEQLEKKKRDEQLEKKKRDEQLEKKKRDEQLEKKKRDEQLEKDKRNEQQTAEIWYTVYNISKPSPFLTTKIRILRKQNNAWTKVVPTVTLSSSAKNYATRNVTISFTSHTPHTRSIGSNGVTRGLNPNKLKLIVANNTDEILVLNVAKLHQPVDFENSSLVEKISDDICTARRHTTRRADSCAVDNLKDMQFEQMNMATCKNDPKKLCLNIMNYSQTSPYKITVQIPFQRDTNKLIHTEQRIKLAKILVDGTVDSQLDIKFYIMNMGLENTFFNVSIGKCSLLSTMKLTKGGHFPPHQNVEVHFKIKLPAYYHQKEEKCTVTVKNDKNVIISQREFLIKPGSRCFCVWYCSCFCGNSYISADSHEECNAMSNLKAAGAGFNEEDIIDSENHRFQFDIHSILYIALMVILALLLCGLAKALLGCCFDPIGKWKYSLIQAIPYENSTNCRRFLMNLLFCFLCPCAICCYCCFAHPTENDQLNSTSSTWGRKIKQVRLDEEAVESERLLAKYKSKKHHKNDDDEDEEMKKLLKTSEKYESFDNIRQNTNMNMKIPDLEPYNDEEEERDTDFVLSALTESRESLKLLDGHASETSASSNPRYPEAVKFVRALLDSKMVYRTMNDVIGFVNLPEGQTYSIRGYFIPGLGAGYQFITYIPLRQHWKLMDSGAKNKLQPIIPPRLLVAPDFQRNYFNKMDVLEAGDLSLKPSSTAPCINVQVQDESMYT